MYCEHCGLLNDDDSAFCAECGNALSQPVIDLQEAIPVSEPTGETAIESAPLKKGFLATVFKWDIDNLGKRRPIYQVLLSIFLCLILFFSSLCLNLIVGCKKTVSEENLTSILNDIDLEEISLLDEAELDLTEEVFEQLTYAQEFANMSKDALEEYIDQPVFKEFIAKKASQLITDFLTDDGSFITTPRELNRLFAKADDVLSEDLGIYVPEETYQQLSIKISNNLNEIEPAEENDYLLVTQSIFSATTLILLYIIVFLSIVLIWLVNGKRLLHLFSSIGINSIIVGFVLISTKLFVYLLKLAFNPGAKEFAAIEKVLSAVTGSFATTGIILLVIGIVLYVASFIVTRIIRKRLKTEIPKEV